MTAVTTTLAVEERTDVADTDAFKSLVERLSRQSVTKHFDAYADVAWDDPEMQIDPTDPRWEHGVLVRRNQRDPSKRAYYFVFAPAGTTLAELAGVAGLRWTIEECFQRAKDDLGLDHCEARSWHGWNRHMSLVMAALAFLASLSAQLRRDTWSKPNKRSPAAIVA